MKTIFSLFLLVFMSLAIAGTVIQVKDAGSINVQCAHLSGVENGLDTHTHSDCTQSSVIIDVDSSFEIMVLKTVPDFFIIDTSYVSITLKVATPPPTT